MSAQHLATPSHDITAETLADSTNAPSKRPSLVLVSPWDLDAPGGVTQVIANLYRQAAADGDFEPLLLVNRWSARRPIEAIVDGRRTIYFRLGSPWPNGTVVGFLKWLVRSPLFFADLWRLCLVVTAWLQSTHTTRLSRASALLCFGRFACTAGS